MAPGDAACIGQAQQKDPGDKIPVPTNIEFVGPLGEGSFGEVTLWKDTQTGFAYAKKIIPEYAWEGCKNEIEMQMKAQPCKYCIKFVKDLDIENGKHGKVRAFLLEYLRDGMLIEYILPGKGLGQFDIKVTFSQIATAVRAMHKHGLVHNDLRPENVFCEKGTQPMTSEVTSVCKVGDYGLSQEILPGRRCSKWDGGSDHYMPPEVMALRGLARLRPCPGIEIDIWSLGVILYQLYTGTLPFKGGSPNMTLSDQVSKGEYEVSEKIPQDAKDLLKRMLEVDVAKRIKIVELCCDWPAFCSP